MSLGAGLAAMAIATPTQAMSIQELFNGVSKDTQPVAVVMALKTEAFRNAHAGLIARSECIETNLIPHNNTDAPGFDSLEEHMLGSKNKVVETVESYIMKSIKIFCSSPVTEQHSTSEAPTKFRPTPVADFYKAIPDNAEKIVVLNLALSTQAARVAHAGDAARGRCTDGLEVKIVGGRPIIPDVFKRDVMQRLAVAHASGSTSEFVEGIVIQAITKNCGIETNKE